jgi:catechol 2,3-dioxygenase-like lactoylglutathione lyase family enzyme
MFSHVMVGSNDIERSKTFYDALFAAIGGKPGRVDPKGRLSYLHKGAAFMVSKPIDGQAACRANGGTIGFSMDGPEQVEAWHKAGTASGGATCEDPPGRSSRMSLVPSRGASPMPRDWSAKASFPKGSRPGTMNTTSSVMRPSTVSRSPARLAAIQVATSSRMARSSSVTALPPSP